MMQKILQNSSSTYYIFYNIKKNYGYQILGVSITQNGLLSNCCKCLWDGLISFMSRDVLTHISAEGKREKIKKGELSCQPSSFEELK